MKRARLAIATAALLCSLLSCQGGPFGGSASAPMSGAWRLVASESAISFVGIKNNAVAVVGAFSGIDGGFDVEKREGSVEVRVGTLMTGDAGRDENLRVHFFDSLQFPSARFALTGTPSVAELPAVGAELDTTLAGKLSLHGAELPLAVPVRITRVAANRIRVRNTKPVVLSVKDLGMEQPLALLKAVCGHEAVSGAVPIEIDLLFSPT